MSSSTEIVNALTAVVAVMVAGIAWATALNALRTSYRPVLRAVPMKAESGEPFGVSGRKLLLKNIGFGPAISVMFFEDPTSAEARPWAAIDLVERLAEPEGESEARRHGRTEMLLQHPMQQTRRYRVVYQDIAGGWHETRFTCQQQEFQVRLLGPHRWWHRFNADRRIPTWARERAQAVRVPEGV